MKLSRFFPSTLLLAVLVLPASADEREITPEQQAAVAAGGDLTEEMMERPNNLPDLTKGEGLPPSKDKPQVWHLGPTGISCIMSGGFPGDQLLVQGTIKGSPADGKLLPGDVITGINGVKFQAGGHLGETIGNAIVEAEKEEKGGKMVFQVWRDKNYHARSGSKNIAGTDIDQLINEAENDDSLYDWKPEQARKDEVAKMDLDKFPIDPITLDVELKLRVFPAYTDTAPYECPKTKQILEDAWKVLEQRFVVDPKKPGSGKGGVIEAMALIASGKPEHRKLVHDWVRSKNCPWQPPTQPIGAMFEPGYKGHKGYQSWHHGFVGLNCALYYEATGDDYVLPALRKYAIETAMGQSKAGSWGHTFAYPSFNGGQFHMMNPGYGALNAAGNRCFFLIVLAKKLGIEHPEIDLAIKRAHRFFGSYVDQGAIPYGDHAAAGTDDSNGKNTGIAFAMKLLGDDYGAKYFAMMSSHCAFTRRGGHGHDYHGEWSSWAASLCGPQVRAYNERNLRWRRTLCRMHDGSFVYHSPTGGKYGTLRDPTATEVFHQAVYLKQTLITGKDADEGLYPTERELKQLMASAYGQFNNSWLKDIAGKPWIQRSTDELFDLLDIFMPKTRKAVAAELGKRFKAGESAIAPRLVALLTHENARMRHGALCGLDACGNDVMLSNLSKIIPFLEAPQDFIRITAVEVVSKATDDKEVQLALLKTTVADQSTVAPNSVRNAVQTSFMASGNALSQSPFQAGFDKTLVEQALTNLILEDTGGGPLVQSKIKEWDKDTVIRLAGPLTYIAEEEQVFDQMFGARNAPAQAMLGKFGYLEAAQASGYRIRKKAEIPRHIRADAGFKDPLIKPDVVARQPGVFADLTGEIKTILIDNPLEEIEVKDESTKWLSVVTPLSKILKIIEGNKQPVALPSIADDVRRLFQTELGAADGNGAKIKLCRAVLADPSHKDTFRQIAAMDQLSELLGPESCEDLLPYLGHEYWRLRDHSRQLASGHFKGMGEAEIAALCAVADAQAQTGFLETLALAKPKAGLNTAKQAMNHASPAVRAAAITAYASLGGEAVTNEILKHLLSARTIEERHACEYALLSRIANQSAADQIRDRLAGMTSDAPPELLDSLYYLIARIGDTKCIDILRKAAATDDAKAFNRIMIALSYSPAREADKVMLDLAAANPKRAQIIGPHAVRRMVIGPKGYGDITSDQCMDFADAMLKLTLEPRIVKLLGSIHEARALSTLMFCLEKGVAAAAGSLITNAEGLEKLSPADSRIAAKALQDVIEYIEVTRLRGGVKAHMDKDDNYTEWKALQARAGKALLKVHKPETAPIPGFDALELNE